MLVGGRFFTGFPENLPLRKITLRNTATPCRLPPQFDWKAMPLLLASIGSGRADHHAKAEIAAQGFFIALNITFRSSRALDGQCILQQGMKQQ